MDIESMVQEWNKWTVTTLRRFAKDNEIDLGAATRKADIISVLEAAAIAQELPVSTPESEAGENTTPEARNADTSAQGVTEGKESDPPGSGETLPEENAAGNVTENSTNDPPATFNLNRVLLVKKPLMRGEDVKAVQEALIAQGLHVGATGADGRYTADTAKAVRHFQAGRGLVVNGKVASQTAAALGADWTGR